MSQINSIIIIVLSQILLSSLAFNCSDITNSTLCSLSISCAWDSNGCSGSINIACSGNCFYAQNYDTTLSGNGTLQNPANLSYCLLSSASQPSTIILITLNEEDVFKVANSQTLYQSIIIRPFLDFVQPRIQIANSASISLTSSSNLDPAQTMLSFQGIVLESEQYDLKRSTPLFLLSATQVEFQNSVVQNFQSTVLLTSLNFASFHFLNSVMRDCYNFGVNYPVINNLWIPKSFLIISNSSLENLSGQSFISITNTVQAKLTNISMINITQESSQDDPVCWIHAQQDTSITINGLSVVNSSLCFLRIEMQSYNTNPFILDALEFINIDLLKFKTLFWITNSNQLQISNSGFFNIINSQSIIIYQDSQDVRLLNIKFQNVSSSPTGNLQIIEDVKLIGSLISTFASSGSFDNFSLVDISLPAIYFEEAELTISDSLFQNNSYSNIINLNYGSLIVAQASSLSFKNNIVDGFVGLNGAVLSAIGYSAESIELQFNNSVFRNNIAESFGGVLYSENYLCVITINNCSFINNSALSGGSIYIEPLKLDAKDASQPYAIQITNSLFASNRAQNKGGALYSKDFISIIGSSFTSNSATYGGSIYRSLSLGENEDNVQNELKSCIFEDNTAIIDGGAIFVLSKKQYMKVSNLQFSSNYASTNPDFFIGVPTVPLVKIYANGQRRLQEGNQRQLETFAQINASKSIEIFTSNNTDEIMKYTVQQESGSSFQNIVEISVLDEDGNVLTGINGDMVNLYLENCSTNGSGSLKGETVFTFQQGYILLYDQIQLYGNTNEKCTFKVRSNLETSTVLQDTNFVLDLDLNIFFSNCTPGQIYDKESQTCKTCQPGSYSLTAPDDTYQCKVCPFDRAICPGGDKLIVKPGFWRAGISDDNIKECPDGPTICLGSLVGENYVPEGQCNAKRQGPLCDECIMGYTKIDDISSCTNCSVDKAYYIRYVIFLVIQLGTIIFSIRSFIQKVKSSLDLNELKKSDAIKASFRTTALKINLNFLQSLSLILRFQLKWPQQFKVFSLLFTAIVPMDENFMVSKCFLDLMFDGSTSYHYAQFIIICFLPIILWVIWIIFLKCFKFRRIQGADATINYNKSITISFLAIALVFRPLILQLGLKSFDCQHPINETNGSTYMYADNQIECGSTQFYKLNFGIVVPLLLIWNLLLPIILFIRLRQNQKAKEKASKSILVLFTSDEFTRRSSWSYILSACKFILTLLYTFGRMISRRFQTLLAFSLLASMLFYQLTIKPYKDSRLNKLESLSLFILVAYSYSGLFFVDNSSTDAPVSLPFVIPFALLLSTYTSYFVFLMIKPFAGKVHPSQALLLDQTNGAESSRMNLKMLRDKIIDTDPKNSTLSKRRNALIKNQTDGFGMNSKKKVLSGTTLASTILKLRKIFH